MKSVAVSVPTIILVFAIAWYSTGMIAYKNAWQKTNSQDTDRTSSNVTAIELSPVVRESFFAVWPRDLIKELLVRMTVERIEKKEGSTESQSQESSVLALKVYPFVLTKITDEAATNTVINHLYFGKGQDAKPIYGLEQAAAEFFHRPFAELSAAEIATLAVISKSPSKYNPTTNPESTDVVLRQKNFILDELVRLRVLEKQAADAEKAKSLAFGPAPAEAATPNESSTTSEPNVN